MHYVRRYAGLIVALVALCTGGYALTNFSWRRVPLKNVQMQPTLKPGDWLTTELRVSPYELEHGEIVRYIYRHGGYDGENIFLGRLVAFPGESIAIRNGQIYRAEVGRRIDFERDAVKETYLDARILDPKVNFQEILVPRGHVFLLTDNRKPPATRNIQRYLLDSRHFGPIPTSLIIGRVEFD